MEQPLYCYWLFEHTKEHHCNNIKLGLCSKCNSKNSLVKIVYKANVIITIKLLMTSCHIIHQKNVKTKITRGKTWTYLTYDVCVF